MGKLSVSDVLRRSAAAWQLKDLWKAVQQEAYELAMPSHNPYAGAENAPKPTSQMLDSTAMTSTFKLANRILMELLPPDDTWVNFEIGPLLDIQLGDDKAKKEGWNKELEKVQKVVSLALNNPAFSNAAVLSILEMIVAGLGAMLILEDKKSQTHPIIYQNVPQAEIAIEDGPNGYVEGVFRKRKIKARLIERTWPDAKLPDELQQTIKNLKADKDPEIEVHEVTYFDGDSKMPWRYEVIWKNGSSGKRLVERQYSTNPWIFWRWFKTPGSPYGPGPVILSLPDIRTANKVLELVMVNALIALYGMYLVKDDGVLNPDNIQITQGGMIPVASTGGTIGASMVPLESGRGFDLGQIVLKDLRAQIRKNLLDYSLPDMEGPVRSPTEYITRTRESIQDYGGAVYRIINESVVPAVIRVTDVMGRNGFVPPDLKVDQFLLKVRVTSPMAQAQKIQETERVVQWLDLILKFIGPQAMPLHVNMNKLPSYLGNQIGAPSELILTEDERLKLQSDIAQVAAGVQQQTATNPQQQAA